MVDDILKNSTGHLGIVFDLESAGFTTEEALELANLADRILRNNPEIGYVKLMQAFRTLFVVPRVECEILEKLVDEGAFDRVQVITRDELERVLRPDKEE